VATEEVRQHIVDVKLRMQRFVSVAQRLPRDRQARAGWHLATARKDQVFVCDLMVRLLARDHADLALPHPTRRPTKMKPSVWAIWKTFLSLLIPGGSSKLNVSVRVVKVVLGEMNQCPVIG
jgi:hypothetical protein